MGSMVAQIASQRQTLVDFAFALINTGTHPVYPAVLAYCEQHLGKLTGICIVCPYAVGTAEA